LPVHNPKPNCVYISKVTLTIIVNLASTGSHYPSIQCSFITFVVKLLQTTNRTLPCGQRYVAHILFYRTISTIEHKEAISYSSLTYITCRSTVLCGCRTRIWKSSPTVPKWSSGHQMTTWEQWGMTSVQSNFGTHATYRFRRYYFGTVGHTISVQFFDHISR